MRFIIIICFLILSAWIYPDGKESNTAMTNLSAYTVNDSIYVNVLGSPEGKPVTSGYPDYKPSWSVDGKWIVFFRITGNNGPDISRWKTAICIVRPDGSELKQLTSGRFTDYNPTWSREGSNYIIINRYDLVKRRCYIYRTTTDSKPGDEILISDPEFSEFGNTCTRDGRIIVSSGRGYAKNVSYMLFSMPGNDGFFRPPFVYFLTPEPGKTGTYEEIKFGYKLDALPSRLTLSKNEKYITYELDSSWGDFAYNGHPLAYARIDVKNMEVSNAVVFSQTISTVTSIYPTFTADENGIIYCSARNGTFQFYYYDLLTKETRRVSPNNGADYKYYCPEAVPK